MTIEEFKIALLDKSIKCGFEEAEVYYVKRESLNITVYEQEVDKYSLNKTFGLSFRGKIDGKMGYSYSEILDEDAIDMLINNAKQGALAIENDDEQFIYKGDKEYSKVETYSKELEHVDAEKLIELALNIEKEAKAYSDKVVNITGCSIGYANAIYGLSNTKGLSLENKDNILTAYVCPVVEDNNVKYNGTGYVVAYSIDDVDPKKIAKEGVEEALSRIGGESIDSGKYKTIINNEAMVSLLGAFVGIFDADAAQKGLSLLNGKEGEKVASDIVTIVDDPLLKRGLSSAPFDDEGVATFKKDIIKNGTLNTLLHNLKTANKAGIKTTGNGFKGSYASPVSISPTNFYIEKGEKDFKEMVKEVNEGIIITDFAGLHSGANYITGDFSLAAKGFLIKDGKKDRPVEQITVAGNFFELLKAIKEISSDLKFPMSSIGSPSVYVGELSIAGK